MITVTIADVIVINFKK